MGFGIRDSGFAGTNPDPAERIPNLESQIPNPPRIPNPKSRIPSVLNAIADHDAGARAGWSLVDLASAFLDGGARFIQVRAKSLPSSALLDAVEAIVARAAGTGALILVNDRADIAAIGGAHGVHVGQDDLRPVEVRRIVGADAVVGLSTHTATQIDAALEQPISYLAIGPVFGTSTKATGYDPIGFERVRAASAAARPLGLPVVAIGGITLDTAADVIGAGATSVAVIGDLLVGNDPAGRVRAFLDRLDGP